MDNNNKSRLAFREYTFEIIFAVTSYSLKSTGTNIYLYNIFKNNLKLPIRQLYYICDSKYHVKMIIWN